MLSNFCWQSNYNICLTKHEFLILVTNLDSTVKPKPILQLNGVTEYILYIGKNIV